MNGHLAWFLFQVLPATGALLFTIYLTLIITSPTRLKAKMSKHKGTPVNDIYRRFYNKYFLGAWICVTLFFVSGIAFDIYKSTHAPSTFMAFFALLVTIATVLTGSFLMSRAPKK